MGIVGSFQDVIRWPERGFRERLNTVLKGGSCSVEWMTVAKTFRRIDGGLRPFVL